MGKHSSNSSSQNSGGSDPGADFDRIYAETSARIEASGGTPLPNNTATPGANLPDDED